MKNYVDVYFNLVGDVYAKYTVSAATQAEGGTIEPVFVAIAPTDPKLKELCEEEVLCFPVRMLPSTMMPGARSVLRPTIRTGCIPP